MCVFQVSDIAKIGGSNNYNFVKRALSSLISDEIALKYSWYGRKGKKIFKYLTTSKLIIRKYYCIIIYYRL